MKKLLLLIALSSNSYAETVTIDDIQLPSNINKAQWLNDNTALPFNPIQEYDIPFEPYNQNIKRTSLQSYNCQYGMDILGGCKIKQRIYKSHKNKK